MPTTVEIVSGYAVLVRAAGSVLRKIQGAAGSVQVTERHEVAREVALRRARDYPGLVGLSLPRAPESPAGGALVRSPGLACHCGWMPTSMPGCRRARGCA